MVWPARSCRWGTDSENHETQSIIQQPSRVSAPPPALALSLGEDLCEPYQLRVKRRTGGARGFAERGRANLLVHEPKRDPMRIGTQIFRSGCAQDGSAHAIEHHRCSNALNVSELGRAQLEIKSLAVFDEVSFQRCDFRLGLLGNHDDRVTLAATLSRANGCCRTTAIWGTSGIMMASAPPAMPAIRAR